MIMFQVPRRACKEKRWRKKLFLAPSPAKGAIATQGAESIAAIQHLSSDFFLRTKLRWLPGAQE